MKIKRNSSEEEWWRSFNDPVYSKEHIRHKVMQTIDDVERETFEHASSNLEKRTEKARVEREEETEEEEEERVNRASAYREVEENSPEPENDENNKGDVRKSVRCPHCGETVWL